MQNKQCPKNDEQANREYYDFLSEYGPIISGASNNIEKLSATKAALENLRWKYSNNPLIQAKLNAASRKLTSYADNLSDVREYLSRRFKTDILPAEASIHRLVEYAQQHGMSAEDLQKLIERRNEVSQLTRDIDNLRLHAKNFARNAALATVGKVADWYVPIVDFANCNYAKAGKETLKTLGSGWAAAAVVAVTPVGWGLLAGAVIAGAVSYFASEFIDSAVDGVYNAYTGSNDGIPDDVTCSDSKPDISEAECTTSPLVIDLNKNGIQTFPLGIATRFDLDNSGFTERTGWLNEKDGFLALDLNGNGKIDNGSELFGNHTVLADGSLATDGFTALQQYDENGDGIISSADSIWSKLKVWQDKNINAKTEDGELHSLDELGITSINVQAQAVKETDESGNQISHRAEVNWADGDTSNIEDVWFRVNTADSKYVGNVDISDDILSLPDAHGFGNVPNLHVAMARDAVLKGMVEAYVAADTETRATMLDNLIYRWTGSEGVDPYSRDPKKVYGHVMDARQLVTLEHLTGHGYLGTWCWGERDPNPHGRAAPKLIAEYQKFANYVRATIADQVDYGGIFAPQAANLDPGTGKMIHDWSQVDQALLSAYESGNEVQVLALVRHMEDVATYHRAYSKEMESHFHDLAQQHGGVFAALIDHRYFNGTEGSDTLLGSEKDEIFDGHAGNDNLQGGKGDDIYRFSGAFGDDRIYDKEGNDTLVFTDAAITPQSLRFSRNATSVFVHTPQGNIQIDNFYDFDGSVSEGRIENIQFADGTRWEWEDIDAALQPNPTEGNDELYYTAEDDNIQALSGDDEIYAGDGNNTVDAGAGDDIVYTGNDNDIITGGRGNDTLNGGNGADTYHYSLGDGHDTIIDHFEESSDNNRLVLHDIQPADILLLRDKDNLLIKHKETEHTITVENYFNGQQESGYVFDHIEFDDGSILTTESIRTLVQQSSEQSDTLYGYSSDDTLEGSGGNDKLYGYDGNDTLHGNAGDDELDGGAGDDVLDGGKGHDTLRGGSGADTYLYRLGDGNDRITNADGDGSGADALQLNGIQPNQVRATRDNKALLLHLADGAVITITDYFDGSDVSSNAIEQIQFADGSTWDVAQVKQQVQQSSEQDDKLYGYDGADTLNGQSGDDRILGYGGNDTLDGGEGNDHIDGGAGDDQIIGGKGDDTLTGGTGNDTYHYNAGDGNDTIYNTDNSGSSDTLALHGITTDEITASRSGNSLILTHANGETVTVSGYFDQNGARPDALAAIMFDDGTIWDVPTVKTLVQQSSAQADKLYGYAGGDTLDGAGGDDTLYGNDGNDVLSGGEDNDRLDGGNGNDTLNGGKGDDTLSGGAGNDTYIYRHGDGNDIIYNHGNREGEQDVLLLEDINADAVRATREQNNLVLHFDNGQTVRVSSYFSQDGNGGDALQTIRFADGSKWDIDTVKTLVQQGSAQADTLYGYAIDDNLDGQAGDDTLYGRGGNDTLHGGEGNDHLYGEEDDDQLFGDRGADHLDGGKGNDRLEGGSGDDTLNGGKDDDVLLGGAGNDTYLFRSGDGHDTILADQLADYETNTLRLQDVGEETVNFKQDGDDLLIVLNESNDSIRVEDYFAENVSKRGIDRIVFGNGVVLQHEDISNRTLHETEGDDILVGSPYDDVIDGKDGNDDITGGKGNDTLAGGNGNDTFHYNSGDGHDTISDASGNDSIVFGENIRREDVSFSRTGNHLLVSVAGEAAMTLNDWFSDEANRIEHFRFNDGSELGIEDLKAINIHSQFGEEDDVIVGWDGIETIDGGAGNDTISGAAGDDHLIGGAGNDILEGGAGADTLEGGSGDDTYRIDGDDTIIEKAGGGYDMVETNGSFDLNGTELEAVTLLGDDNTDALGNDADNRLIGNSGNNRFDGRNGADIMQGGAGDDYYVVDRYDNVAHDSNWSGYLVEGDKVIEEADSGIDTIERSADPLIITRDGLGNPVNSGQYADLEANVENLILTGDAVSAYGNALDNDIVLNAADNIVNGRGGNDTIHYAMGGGKDEMHFLDNVNATDTLHIAGISDEQAQVTREGDDIIITFDGHEGDQITLKDYFKEGSSNGDNHFDNKVDKIVFDANGREWDQAYLEHLAQGGTHSTAPVAVDNSIIDGIEAEPLNANLNDYFSDNEGDALSYSVTMADGSELPDWLHVDNQTGIITGRPPLGAEDLQLNVVAREASSLSASTTLTLSIADNQAPILISTPDDIAATEAVAFSVTLSDDLFSDPEGHELSYELSTADGSALPDWLHFDAAQRTITGTAPADIEQLGLRLKAVDAAGLHSDVTFNLSIAANQAPVLSAPYADIRINEGDTFSKVIDLNRFSDPEGSALNFSVVQANGEALPDWLTFDAASGLFSGTAPQGSKAIDLKIEATDGAGYSTSDYFGMSINAAPQINGALQAQATEEGARWIYELPTNQFVDPEDDDIAYSISLDNGQPLPSWMHYDEESHTVTADMPVGQDDFNLEITATDSEGLSKTAAVSIDVTHTDRELNTPWYGGSITGWSGDDVLTGSWFQDTLEGGKGNDLLRGSIGSDTYRFTKGDGQDTIDDAGGLNDKLVLNGYKLNEISIEHDGYDQILHFTGSDDNIVIKNRYLGAARGRMEHIEVGGETLGFRDFESKVKTFSPAASTTTRAANDDRSALQAQNMVSAMAAFGTGQDLDKLSTPDIQQSLLIVPSSEKVI